MSRVFPTIADARGYATTGQTGFLLGMSPTAAPGVNASAPARRAPSAAEDREHAATMARCFPAVAKVNGGGRRARIERFS